MSVPTIVVDRIEGSVAVLVMGSETLEIPAALLPDGAGEGTILRLEVVSTQPDRTAAQSRLNRMQAQSDIGNDFSF